MTDGNPGPRRPAEEQRRGSWGKPRRPAWFRGTRLTLTMLSYSLDPGRAFLTKQRGARTRGPPPGRCCCPPSSQDGSSQFTPLASSVKGHKRAQSSAGAGRPPPWV